MNKNRYRVIFNKARGMMMAVAESASSHSSNPRNQAARADADQPAVQTSTSHGQWQQQALLGLLLANTLILPNISYAQIVAAANVSASHSPSIGVTNNIPVINVTTPNANGVSRNIYSQMDILSNGVVINNSRQGASSVLAGSVSANPYMAAGEASVIVNEIRSTAPTRFEGNLEVAGRKADVIIANPAGLNVQGAGFINANRATLTTGVPDFDTAGNLTKFSVKQGIVQIEQGTNGQGIGGFTENGLKNNPTFLEILARSAVVNAAISANHTINVVTGANIISPNLNSVTTQNGSGTTPIVKLDVGALGGMYSGNIYLVGTESGMGFRNSGTISAGTNLVVTSGGRLENLGTLRTTGIAAQTAPVLSVTTTYTTPTASFGDINNTGNISSKGLLIIDAGRNINHTGGEIKQTDLLSTAPVIISANGGLAQTNSSQIINAGTGAISIDAGSNKTKSIILDNNTKIEGQGDIYVSSGLRIDLKTNSSISAKKDLTLLAEHAINLGSANLSSLEGTIHLESAQPSAVTTTTDTTTPVAENHLNIEGGRFTAGKSINLVADNNINLNPAEITATTLNADAGDNLTYTPSAQRKFIATTGAINLKAGDQLTISGENIAEADRTLKSESQLNIQGGSVTTKAVELNGHVGLSVVADQGDILLDQGTKLTSGHSRGGVQVSALAGDVTANGLSASAVNSTLSILAKGDVVLNSKKTSTEFQKDGQSYLENVSIATYLRGRNGINLGSIGDGNLNLGYVDAYSSQGTMQLLAGNDITNTVEVKSVLGLTTPGLVEASVYQSQLRAHDISVQAKSNINLSNIKLRADVGALTGRNISLHANRENRLDTVSIYSGVADNTASLGNIQISSGNQELNLSGVTALAHNGHISVSSNYLINMNSFMEQLFNADGTPQLTGAGNLRYGVNWTPTSRNSFIAKGIVSIHSNASQNLQNTSISAGAININSRLGLTLKGIVNWNAKGSDLLRSDDSLLSTKSTEPEKRVRDLDGDLSIDVRGGSLILTPDMLFAATGDIDIRVRDQLRMTGVAGTNGNASAKTFDLEAGKSMTLVGGNLLLQAPSLEAQNGDLNLVATNGSIVVDAIKNNFTNKAATGTVSMLNLERQNIITEKNNTFTVQNLNLFALVGIDAAELEAKFDAQIADIDQAISHLSSSQGRGMEHSISELSATNGVLNVISSGGISMQGTNLIADSIYIHSQGSIAESVSIKDPKTNIINTNPLGIKIVGVQDIFEKGSAASENYQYLQFNIGGNIFTGSSDKIGGDINIIAQGDGNSILLGGSDIETRKDSILNIRTGDIRINAEGHIKLESATEDYYDYVTKKYKTGKWYKRKTITEIRTNQNTSADPVSLQAGTISLNADGGIEAYATGFRSTWETEITAGQGLSFFAVPEVDFTKIDRRVKSSMFGVKYKDVKSSSSLRVESDLPAQVVASSAVTNSGWDTRLQGTVFNTLAGATISAGVGPNARPDAQIILEGIKTTVTKEQTRESSSIVWQKMSGQGSTTQTLELPKFTGPVAPVLKAPSIVIDIPENPQGVEAGLDQLLKDPAYSYLNDLRIRDDVKWNEIKLIVDSWEYEQEGLTEAGAALIAIAVAWATGGMGAELLGGGGVMSNAAFSSLASQAAITLVNNKGDIGKTLQDLESSDTIKQMATAALTAGLLEKVGGTSWMQKVNGTGLSDRLITGLVNSTGSALVSTAINGGSLSENLEQALISGTVTALHGALAGEIKTLESDTLDINYLLHKIAHAAAGCAAAAAQKQECEAGAIGAAVGEMVAELMPRVDPSLSPDEYNKGQKNIKELSKLVAGAVAAYSGYDVNTAAFIAENAIKNNRQLNTQEQELIKKLANGDKQREQRLYTAACALIRCSAHIPEDSPEYALAKRMEDIGSSSAYQFERNLLSNQRLPTVNPRQTQGYLLFQPSSDVVENFRKLDTKYQLGTRAGGVLMIAGGLTGGAASTVGLSTCVTGVGCLLAAGGITYSADLAAAGLSTVWEGKPQSTLGAHAIHLTTGIPLDIAEALYGTLGLAGAVRPIQTGLAQAQQAGATTVKTATPRNFTTSNASVLQGDEPLTLTPKIPIIEGRPYPKETAFAQELAAQGNHVIVRGRDASGADFIINNVKWELKTLESPSVNAVQQNIRKAKDQSDHIFIDGRAAGLTQSTAMQGLSSITRMNRVGSAQTIVVKTPVGDAVWRKDSPVPLTWLPGGVR